MSDNLNAIRPAANAVGVPGRGMAGEMARISSPPKRVEWIDLAKFFAISLMVMGHLGLPKPASRLIHVFHMPVFFLLSGYCFNEIKHRKLGPFLLSRTKSILVPYFFWAVATYAVYWASPCYRSLGQFVPPETFLRALFSQDAAVSLFGGFGVLQWFLTALFGAECFLWLFSFAKRKMCAGRNWLTQWVFRGLCFAAFLSLNHWVVSSSFPNVLGAKSSIMGGLLCIIGFECKKHLPGNVKHKGILLAVLSVVCGMVCLFAWKCNGSVNMRLPKYNNVFLFLAGALSGSLLVAIAGIALENVSRRFFGREPGKGLFPWRTIYKGALLLGQNTIIILCLNRLLQYSVVLLFNEGLKHFMDIESGVGLYIRQVSGFFVEIIFFVPVILLINKYLSFSIGRKFPARQG